MSGNQSKGYGFGVATQTQSGQILECSFYSLGLGDAPTNKSDNQFDALLGEDSIRKVKKVAVEVVINLDEKPKDAADVYLRLHLLSHRFVAPHSINLDGIFGLLANVVWTSAGACEVEGFEKIRPQLQSKFGNLVVYSVDKFPRMIDYVIPDSVRIADGDRVRLGAVNVGGIMYADSDSGLQRTIAQAMRSKLGVGPSKFHTGGSAGESETVYLGTFKKAAILKAGGFDERYIRAQDWELNHRMRAQGGLIWFDPTLKVTYRPRKSISKLAKQYFQYGRWRRVIVKQHPKTTNYRYLAPPVTVVANIVSLAAGVFINPILFIPFISYVILLLIGGLILGRQISDKFLMPLVLATMHISWGMGFLTSPKKLLKS